jgi:hypothetical protein
VDAVTADASRFSIQTTTTWEILVEGAGDGASDGADEGAGAAVGPGVNVGDWTASEPAADADDGPEVGPAVGLESTAPAEGAGLRGGVVAWQAAGRRASATITAARTNPIPAPLFPSGRRPATSVTIRSDPRSGPGSWPVAAPIAARRLPPGPAATFWAMLVPRLNVWPAPVVW